MPEYPEHEKLHAVKDQSQAGADYPCGTEPTRETVRREEATG